MVLKHASKHWLCPPQVTYEFLLDLIDLGVINLCWRKQCEWLQIEAQPNVIGVVCMVSNLLPSEHQQKTNKKTWCNQLWQ